MLLSVVTLLIALGLKYQQQLIPESSSKQQQNETEPDFYLTNTVSFQYDKQGHLHYTFKSEQLQYFAPEDYTLISTPKVTLFQKDGTPWKINSQMGRITDGHKFIKLWDNVKLNRAVPQDPIQMKTQVLTIMPDQNIASTDKDVVIISDSGQVDATGMKVYFDTNKMELLSNVQVHLEPITSN